MSILLAGPLPGRSILLGGVKHTVALGFLQKVGENLALNVYIAQTSMRLNEGGIFGDEAIDDLGSVARTRDFMLGHVAILFTELAVRGHFLEDLTRHFVSVPNLGTIGEEVFDASVGYGADGVVKGANIEAGVMRADDINAFLFELLMNALPRLHNVEDLARTIPDFIIVLRKFLGVIGGLHFILHTVEDFVFNMIGDLADDFSLAVYGASAEVVDERIVKTARGFGVGHVDFQCFHRDALSGLWSILLLSTVLIIA